MQSRADDICRYCSFCLHFPATSVQKGSALRLGDRRCMRCSWDISLSQYVSFVTVGKFPIDSRVLIASTATHLAAIVATFCILLISFIVDCQLLNDSTLISTGLMLLSTAALYIVGRYISHSIRAITRQTHSRKVDSTQPGLALYVLQLPPGTAYQTYRLFLQPYKFAASSCNLCGIAQRCKN
jgi:hypothetical protein